MQRITKNLLSFENQPTLHARNVEIKLKGCFVVVGSLFEGDTVVTSLGHAE